MRLVVLVASLFIVGYNATASSNLTSFRPSSRSVLKPLALGSDTVHWSTCVKYLGVHLVCGKNLKFWCKSICDL